MKDKTHQTPADDPSAPPNGASTQTDGSDGTPIEVARRVDLSQQAKDIVGMMEAALRGLLEIQAEQNAHARAMLDRKLQWIVSTGAEVEGIQVNAHLSL